MVEASPPVTDKIYWKLSLAWLGLLAPLFFLSYGWSNNLAASRNITDSIVFDWESSIPFLPWTIIPYWSIDLMYGLSFLACRSPREVNFHGLRLLTAQGISVACFILFPLRFSAQRPDTEGLFGSLFDALTSFDLPYNQAPSLHISLLLVIWWCVLRRSTNGWRWLLHGWAFLVAISVLTTWQHHFFDLPTGILVGLLCLWLWPDHGEPPHRRQINPKGRRIGMWYLLAASACLFAATSGGWAMWFAWPSSALALVAINYLWSGVTGFQKFEGQQSFAVRWLLAPYRLGAWMNSRLWTRNQPASHQIVDGISLGRIPSTSELRKTQFDSVIDLTAEFNTPTGNQAHYNIPMMDLVIPSIATLSKAVDAINQARETSHQILVCCALGYSRSALTIAAWLLHYGHYSDATSAMNAVRSARPGVVFSAEHQALLEAFSHASP